MDRDEIDEYVQRCQQLIEASPQMDEENTKVKLIQPFLELLGWDLYSTEVALEYTIPMASGSTHVDYALLVGDSPVVFVEAKPVRSTLTDSEVQQLRSYMRQELDVDWGILTNGKSFEVLTKNHRGNGGEEVSVAQFNLDDLSDNPGVLELLTKESIRSGKSDEVAEQVAETNRAIRHLQENEDSVTKAVSEAVEKEVGELTIDLEEQSREFTQNLVSVLREQRHFVSDEPLSKPDKAARASGDKNETTHSTETPEDSISPVPDVSDFKTDTDKRFYKRLKNKSDSQPAVYRRLIRNEGKVSRPRFDELAEKEGFNPGGGGHNASLLVLERVTDEIERRGRGDDQVLVWVGEN
ncbi:type I restriction enzyme HsdR N-terminal domain-containing protein [Haloarcula salinisoli]|uniref:Type I restriction enzyme HsdR N-terminal domain-containing protein n=1 Tax=Haloarcula salinisoli TaxID=2487746 RepID=A0A8J7YKY6_9EURY|nr:type I restriction enzyme HsdR N-terminal domain-containing protein [Halomicroarcula salinisoli]MBX0305236.1 type I restriction enzyme HsdR N-terminal domain-containing protein [Halomicroarcula salinisoli]